MQCLFPQWCTVERRAFSNAGSAQPVYFVTRYGRMDSVLLLPSRRWLYILPECCFYSFEIYRRNNDMPGLLVHARGLLDDAFRAIHSAS